MKDKRADVTDYKASHCYFDVLFYSEARIISGAETGAPLLKWDPVL